MKYKTILSLFLFLASVSVVKSQTAEDIVSKYISFIGGSDKWKKIKTISSSGTYNYGGVEFPFNSFSKAPDRYRYIVTFKGKSFEQGYDGTTGWRIDGFKNEKNKTILKGKQALAMANESDVELESPFIHYEKKGHSIQLEGQDSVGNILCYKIKLTRKEGEEETYFISTANYELVKKNAFAKNTELNNSRLDIFFKDYRTIDGIKVPFKITCNADSQTVLDITVTSVKLNQPIADSSFRP